MKNNVKIKFEKPQVFGAEFLVCFVPTVSATYPGVAPIAVSCSVPALWGAAAFAVGC